MDTTSELEHVMWLERGNSKFIHGDYQGAIADFSTAIELNPGDATVYYSRGLAYLGVGQRDLAMKGLMRASELGYHVPREALDLCNQA